MRTVAINWNAKSIANWSRCGGRSGSTSPRRPGGRCRNWCPHWSRRCDPGTPGCPPDGSTPSSKRSSPRPRRRCAAENNRGSCSRPRPLRAPRRSCCSPPASSRPATAVSWNGACAKSSGSRAARSGSTCGCGRNARAADRAAPRKVLSMSLFEVALIMLAGLGAGAINSLVGSGTLITFPTLITLGYAPLTATISNAVGLVAGGVSGTWAYRRELRGQWARLRWQLPGSLLGAVCGAWLLLHLPEQVFNRVVPALLVLALVLVVVGPRIQRLAQRRALAAGRSLEQLSRGRLAALTIGTFAVGVYGGYFSAAQGILLVGVIGCFCQSRWSGLMS